MSLGKRNLKEINVITNSPKRRPYASKITMVLEEGREYGFDGETCALFEGDFIVRIKPEKENPKNDSKKLQQITTFIEGFKTAKEAEEMGLRLTLALLWTAISRKCHLKLKYHTPFPCIVFDRTQNKDGIRMSTLASYTVSTNANKIIELMIPLLLKQDVLDDQFYRLLISMELFTSARLESTARAKFIGLVSSLEPLAIQEDFNNKELDDAISSFKTRINAIASLTDEEKNSIKGRVEHLNKESVSQSILRFVKKHFAQKSEITKVVKEAYDIRSNILHHGNLDYDLEEKRNELEEIMRQIYSKLLQTELDYPAQI